MSSRLVARYAFAILVVVVVIVVVLRHAPPDVDEESAVWVRVDEPPQGTFVEAGDILHGRIQGGTGQVYVWLKHSNHAIPTTMDQQNWSLVLDTSLEGTWTLVLAAQDAGQWGPLTEHILVFPGDGGQQIGEVVGTDRSWWQRAWNHVRAWFTSGDLDGDGVPDRWQGSPTDPRLMAWPYTRLALVALATGSGLLALVAWFWPRIRKHQTTKSPNGHRREV